MLEAEGRREEKIEGIKFFYHAIRHLQKLKIKSILIHKLSIIPLPGGVRGGFPVPCSLFPLFWRCLLSGHDIILNPAIERTVIMKVR